MKPRTADSNYQALAAEFSVGDLVVPYGVSRDYAGRVVALFPAIGMVEMQLPSGNQRLPVEDLQRLDHEGNPIGRMSDTVPGGLPTVSVPGGPVSPKVVTGSASRVAQAFVRRALYWTAPDRKYKATLVELESNAYGCPKCREASLKKAVYRREGGQSERLWGCPSCLFLVRQEEILGLGK